MMLSEVAATSRRLGATASRTAKRGMVAELMAAVPAEETAVVTAWLSGALPQRRTGVGPAQLRDLPPPAAEPTLGVTEVDRIFTELAGLSGPGSQGARARLARELFARADGDEQRLLVGLVTGDVRQGALESLVGEGVAQAHGVPPAVLRRAAMLLGSTPRAAELAASGGAEALAAVRLGVGTPVQPMLASSAPDVDGALAGLALPVVVDHKLDGIRIQAHKEGDEVRLFTRSLDDITHRLPGVVAAVAALPADTLVLDGEVLGLGPGDRPAPFQEIASVAARQSDVDVPERLDLRLYVFDTLHLDGRDLLDEPFEARRRWGESVLPPAMVVPRTVARTAAEARDAFDRAVADGFEGVVVKDPAGTYAAGRRATSWVKVKPRHTLDLVVLAAEWGYGRRTGWLSNLHLGARGDDGFVMVGKTFKGLTDELLRWQTDTFPALATRRTGSTVFLRPEVVVEIALDGIQTSPRYPGGVALRFARVVRYRPDKAAAQASTIDEVRALRSVTLHDGPPEP